MAVKPLMQKVEGLGAHESAILRRALEYRVSGLHAVADRRNMTAKVLLSQSVHLLEGAASSERYPETIRNQAEDLARRIRLIASQRGLELRT